MKQELDVLRKRMLRDLIQAPKSTIDLHQIKQRVEGEIWIEDGKDWIIENGFVKKLTQISKVSKDTTIPNFCPKCLNKMLTNVDMDLYKMYNHCLKCQTKFETKLKVEGKYDQYLKDSHNKEIDYRIGKLKQEFEEYIELSKDKSVMDINFDTEIIKSDIDEDIVKRNIDEKLNYLENLKIF